MTSILENDNTKEIYERLGNCNMTLAEIAGFIIQKNFDEAHHKQWCLDQILRYIALDKYDELIRFVCENDYNWDEGIAP